MQSGHAPESSDHSDFEQLMIAVEANPSCLEAGLGPGQLERRDTHISTVFLSPQRAYKFKRPIHFPFSDQRSLERRRELAERETQLNRRLSSGVYLGVRSLYTEAGRLKLSDGPEPGEPCVVMRRLADAQSLGALIERGDPDLREMALLTGQRLADFHHDLQTRSRNHAGVFARFYRENLEHIASDPEAGPALAEALERFLRKRLPLVEHRARRDRIVQGHGDLRPDHVYVVPGGPPSVQIIDCIEFNDDLSVLDPIEDIAFLSMGLEIEGRTDLKNVLLAAYFGRSADFGGLRVLSLFEIYRACVRIKIDLLQLAGTKPGPRREHLLQRKQAYLDFVRAKLVQRDEEGDRRGELHVIFGVPASGKSHLVREMLLDGQGYPIATDAMRRRLPRTDYTPEGRGRVYRHCRTAARMLIQAGHSVIMDGTYGSRAERDALRAAAARCGTSVRFYMVYADVLIIKERLQRRRETQDQRGQDLSELTDFKTWEELRDRFEMPGPDEKDVQFIEQSS